MVAEGTVMVRCACTGSRRRRHSNRVLSALWHPSASEELIGHSEDGSPGRATIAIYSCATGTTTLSTWHAVEATHTLTPCAEPRPNPSVEARTNGGPPGPSHRYGVHF